MYFQYAKLYQEHKLAKSILTRFNKEKTGIFT